MFSKWDIKMKHLLRLIKQKIKPHKQIQGQSDKASQKFKQVWQAQSDVYYLFDTIKLCYRSSSGQVTIEQIPLDDLKAVIYSHIPLIADGESYSVSVCAVGSEVCGNKRRVKAIANAAIFRARAQTSQALIQAPDLPLDRVFDELTQFDFKRGVQRYNNISLMDFIMQLKSKNESTNSLGMHNSGIKSDNFNSLFSESELRSLRKFGAF